MNRFLKIIVIALAVVIVGTGVAIPLISAASENDTVKTEEASADVQSETAAVESDTAIVAQTEAQTKAGKSMSAAIVVGLAAAAGAIGMALAIAKSVEGVARQPEARSTLMLSLVFIETAIIYALIVAILIIFVL